MSGATLKKIGTTSALNIGDNRVVRGDGGLKGIQGSGVTLDDSDNMSGVNTLSVVDGVTTRANLGLTIGSDIQAWDTDLDALAGLGSTGMVSRTGAGTASVRTITGTASRLSVADGDGVAGNPTLDIDSSYVGQASITTIGTITTGVWTGTTIAVANGGTGQSTYTKGDILYSDAANSLAKLAAPSKAGAHLIFDENATPVWYDPAKHFYGHEEFLIQDDASAGAGIFDLNLDKINGASGAIVASSITGGRNGVLSVRTGATQATGAARMVNEEQHMVGGGFQRYECSIKTDTALSSGTQTYTYFIGLHDSVLGSTPTDGIYFEYSDGTNSGKWVGRCTSSSSTSSANSDDTVLADTWFNLAFEVNADASSVSFFVDGVEMDNSPLTTNIPSVPLSVDFSIVKSVGTFLRELFMDYVSLFINYTTAR